ncbi:MAG TPA: SpoIIE family protein phosphatase [Candidatus Acidoferrales bacterium]|nr:SpoIIE family protein phosphatase [Candidatus Acidoferrales bacterium]
MHGVLTDPAELAHVLDALPAPALLALDARGDEIRCNQAFRRLLAWDVATLPRTRGIRYFDRARLLRSDEQPLTRALCGEPVSGMPVEIERPDGTLHAVIASSMPLRAGDGAITGALLILQEVQGAVLEDHVLRELSIHTPALLFTADPRGEVDSINARWNMFVGVAADELLGSGWTRFIHPEDLPRIRADWLRHLNSGEPYASQWRFLRGDGTYRWTEIRAEAQRDAQGKIVRWFGSGTDVDAQRRALDALDFLARTGATLAREQDVPALLDQLAHASLEGLADISIFALEEESGDFRRLVVASPRVPRSSVAITEAFETPRRGEPHPIARAMVTSETIHIPYVDEAFIRRSVTPESRQEAWRFVDIRSIVCAPMITSGRGLGALTLLRTETSVPFETSDMRVIEEVARRAAVAIENVRLRERERRTARNLQAFADMGEALGGSLGLAKTLEAALRVIVPQRADWAYVSLVERESELRLALAYHRDEAKSRLIATRAGELYARLDGTEGAPAVVKTQAPVLLQKIDRSGASIVSARVLRMFGDIGLASAVIVPLFAGSTVRGTLHLCVEDERRTYTRADVEFFQELARRMAPAIANAELFEREQRVARSFQDAALPASLPDVPGVLFDAIYEAGKTEALIGGDWYDAFCLVDGRIVVSIGDVAGSGLEAAVTMGGVRQAIRGAAHVQADPTVMLEAANQTVLADAKQRFVTAFVGVIDLGPAPTITYQAAGHPPPVLRLPDGQLTHLHNQGPPLGLRTGRMQCNQRCALPSGSLLTLFTDGLIESTHDIFEGERRLREALLDPAVLGAAHPAKMLHDAVLVDGARDDIAILTIKMR